MKNLKDSLGENRRTVTLKVSHINYLNRIHIQAQMMLNQLQETLAQEYLHDVAVSDFGMDPNKDLNFEFHPEKEYDNLIITEKAA